MTMNIHEESSLGAVGIPPGLLMNLARQRVGCGRAPLCLLSLLPSSCPLLTHGVWQAQNQGRVAWVLGLVSNLQVSD